MNIRPVFIVICTISALSLLSSPSSAGGKIDGIWSYSTSKSWRKGPCPTGGDAKGTLKVENKAGQVTLTFVSGRTCRPAAMCSFKGTFKGDKLKVANSTRVDDEGGTASNTIELKVTSRTSAAGTSTSSYKHPSGMACNWGSALTLTRK